MSCASTAFKLSSPDFQYGDTMPVAFTCKGANQAPTLEWRDVPEGTKTFVLIVDDPDAPSGTWNHWVLYNIPSTSNSVSDHTSVGTNGVNSALHERYDGPCPPEGTGEHRYFFKLYAVDTILDVPSKNASKDRVKRGMSGHILGTAEYMGTQAP